MVVESNAGLLWVAEESAGAQVEIASIRTEGPSPHDAFPTSSEGMFVSPAAAQIRRTESNVEGSMIF